LVEYVKVNIFCHISGSCLTITTSDIKNIEYFKHNKQKDIFHIYIYYIHIHKYIWKSDRPAAVAKDSPSRCASGVERLAASAVSTPSPENQQRRRQPHDTIITKALIYI